MKKIFFSFILVVSSCVLGLGQASLHFENPPTSVLVNFGSAIYSIPLDAELTGSTSRTDALGTVTINVRLNGAGKLELKVPERNKNFIGEYSEFLTATSKKSASGKQTWNAKNVAVVIDWENFSQSNALDRVKNEMEWRAMNNGKFTLLVEKNDLRVYVTTGASTAMRKIGATLDKEQFSLPRAAYSFKLSSYKGALIFDSSGGNLTMRTMDGGIDETFAIKKSGEVVPASPRNEMTRPRVVNPSERPRVVGNSKTKLV